MKQYEAVIETLDKLGGVATLGELNREVFKISDCEWKTKTGQRNNLRDFIFKHII